MGDPPAGVRHGPRFRWVVSALADRYGGRVPTREVGAAIRAGRPVVIRFKSDSIDFPAD